jgi:prevent-host-death family protein
MKIVPLSEAKAKLSSYVDEAVEDGPVVITKNGRPAAVLVAPMDDEDLERLVIGRSRRFRAILQQSLDEADRGEVMDEESFWAAVDARTAGAAGRATKPED